MSDWNPALYLKFERERTQPSLDLARRIELERVIRIVDLGCGPGNSTAVLRARWPEAEITGVDNSPEMVRKAAATDARTQWVLADAASWAAAEPQDLIYSNATFHWLRNHDDLCRRYFDQLAPGGVLAVQMPAHHDSALHDEMLEVSRDPAWDGRMDGARSAMTHHPPAFYYDLLAPVAARLDIWETVYQHSVEGPESIVSWFRATGLRPYLDALSSDDERARFEGMLLERYTRRYPRRTDGRVLFPFKRLFFVAYHR